MMINLLRRIFFSSASRRPEWCASARREIQLPAVSNRTEWPACVTLTAQADGQVGLVRARVAPAGSRLRLGDERLRASKRSSNGVGSTGLRATPSSADAWN